MRSGNPVLTEKTFSDVAYQGTDSATMSLSGTATKTAMLLVLLVIAAGFTWMQTANGNPALAGPWVVGGLVVGLIAAIATVFKPTWSPITAPIYAVAEGLFLGAVSAMFEAKFGGGIVFNAVCLTFGTLFSLLLAYQSGIIRATENFKLGIFAATGGIALVYLLSFVLSFFGMSIPLIHGSGWVGIGFSVFVVIIAALNLVLDFDFIENGVDQGAPKYMEWYAAFGLLVTLVWLYLEILRLLAKLQSRD